MKNIYIALASISLLIGWYFFNTKKEFETSELIIGTSTDYPPFQYLENNQIIGFEIELMRKIAEYMGRPIIFKDLPFDMLLHEIQMGKIHVIAAALTETPERAKQVLFTPAYMEGDQLLLISRLDNPINNLKDIIKTDKKVIVSEGYTSDSYASKINGLNIIRLKNPAEAFLALKTKKADAFIIAENIAIPFFKKYPKSDFALHEIENTKDSYSLAISKEHPTLLAPIAAALENMKNDGTLKSLKQKWQITL